MIGRPQNYLVVDDDSTNNLICEFSIRKFDKNARINLFLDPDRALKYIEQTYGQPGILIPTVLFLDINMPVMSGFEFLEEFIKFKLEIRQQFTIFILSSSIEDFNDHAIKYPFVTGFLSKPLTSGNLIKIWNQVENLEG